MFQKMLQGGNVTQSFQTEIGCYTENSHVSWSLYKPNRYKKAKILAITNKTNCNTLNIYVAGTVMVDINNIEVGQEFDISGDDGNLGVDLITNSNGLAFIKLELS